LSKEYDAGIVVTCGPMDVEPVQTLISKLTCSYTLVEKRQIRNVAAIIDQLDLLLTNDTGIMHIAGATRPRVLSLFGPTDPLQWAPIGPKNRFISAEDKSIQSITEENVYSMLDVILHEIQQDFKIKLD
jgi:ADP-heptose:LPS heptosyltransferase